MSSILFECDVTEFAIIPKKENDEIAFSIQDSCVVINFMDTRSSINDVIMMQSEMERKDAIELAKLILMKYE